MLVGSFAEKRKTEKKKPRLRLCRVAVVRDGPRDPF